MCLEWNLTDLFQNKEEFYKEIETIKKQITEIEQEETTELDANVLLRLLNEKWAIKERANSILVYGSLVYYKNTTAEECIKMKDVAEKFDNEVNSKLAFIDRKILKVGKKTINTFLKENPNLKTYELSLDNLFRMQEHVQEPEKADQIRQHNDHINEQITLYNKLLRDIKYGTVEIDGQTIELTSSNFAKYLSARERETRKQTYQTINETFKNSQAEFADILDAIMTDRIKNAEFEKYHSVLEKVLFEENIDSKIIEALINAVNNNLNLLQKYLKIKAEQLNINDPHLYDFNVPLDSQQKRKYTEQEAIELIKNALAPLGEKYLAVVNQLLDGHIDAKPDEKKHQTLTFSWNNYSFMNFRGAYIDLKNMVHEIGHIVNYHLSKENLPFLYADSTIFVGETASIVNEILLNRYLCNHAQTEEERIFYLSKEIENYVTSVFKQTMYTEYENELYQTKLAQKLTPEILSEKYGKLLKKYYGKDIVYEDASNAEWTRLGHLYRWSYYPYKYATGLIMASVVVNGLLDDHTITQNQYLEFLSAGSSQYSLDILKLLNMDLTNSHIIDNGFQVLDKDIKRLDKVLTLKK